MGCYYLTAARGQMGESGEAGEGMTFSNAEEVHTAYAHGKLGVHAKIHLRLPAGKKFVTERMVGDKLKIDEELCQDRDRKITTVGRVIFNEILDPQMPFYDLSLSSKMLARIIADCYQILGRRATIDLLDRGADVVVRFNQPLSQAVRDIEHAICPDVDALACTKIGGVSHVQLLDELVSELEEKRGVPVGRTKFIVMVETAAAFFRMRDIVSASPTVSNPADSPSPGKPSFTSSAGSASVTPAARRKERRSSRLAMRI